MSGGKESRGKESRSSLWVETFDAAEPDSRAEVKRIPWLTILHHPTLSRIGEESVLVELDRGNTVALSRTEPEFSSVEGGASTWPLADPFISRKAINLRMKGDAIELEPAEAGVQATIDGAVLAGPLRLPEASLDRGVLIELSGRVIVLLHRRAMRGPRLHDLGLIGHSEAIDEVRTRIFRVANVSVPVLLRGATGTGKELVARAIHDSSDRASEPFEAVNVGAFAPQMAAAELFGHVKGAFTGAAADNPGYFLRANRGTLFLDEIGEAPADVQVMLLRALETSTIQPVGGAGTRPVDVRIVSATDADLDRAVESGKFRSALIHRLRGFEIRIPRLSERREDLGRLILHFVKSALEELGEGQRIAAGGEPTPRPWFPANVARALLSYEWPGNVREMRNTVRQLVIGCRGEEQLSLDRSLEYLAPAAPPPVVAVTPAASEAKRRPGDITEEELLAALTKHKWKLNPTAKYLGISNSSLHMLIDRSPSMRKATDIAREEILEARASVGEDIDEVAESLRVSSRGLRLRLKALGME